LSKLLLFVTEDYYFVSHRLALGIAAKHAGYDVCVVTRVRDNGATIREAGLRLIPFENARSSLNPLTEIGTLVRLVRLYRRERPELLHHVAMKPMLYGSIAARLTGRRAVINAVAGMGWLFTSADGMARWLKPFVRQALKRLVGTGIALVQNPDDAAMLRQLGIPQTRIRIIPGAGVDLARFHPTPTPDGVPVVVLPARLLWDKGLAEFVTAARLLRAKGVVARFIIAGDPDPMNPAAISVEEVTAWVAEGVVEYAGFVADMPALLARSHVVCLPSYREGLPKSLIEAAAAGRAIVTTDVPGCRDVVRNGDNGLLVAPRDSAALAAALERLITDAALRTAMGTRGRLRAEQEFGLDAIIAQTLALYREATT
jgi:glycosyltransferase involved in cell wall biosynthesis